MFQANENITTDSTYNQLPTNIVLPDDIMTLSLEASSANTGTATGRVCGYIGSIPSLAQTVTSCWKV